MASKTSIINRAMHHLGVERIDSPDDGSSQAIDVSDIYNDDLESLLSEHTWKFSIKWQILPRLVTNDNPLWLYGFEVPSSPFKKIRVIDVRRNPDNCLIDDYDYAGQVIYCNVDDIHIKYVAGVSDPNLMAPKFRECLSLKIAISVCIPRTHSLQLKQALENTLKETLDSAKGIDTVDDAMDPLPRSEWLSTFYGNA